MLGAVLLVLLALGGFIGESVASWCTFVFSRPSPGKDAARVGVLEYWGVCPEVQKLSICEGSMSNVPVKQKPSHKHLAGVREK